MSQKPVQKAEPLAVTQGGTPVFRAINFELYAVSELAGALSPATAVPQDQTINFESSTLYQCYAEAHRTHESICIPWHSCRCQLLGLYVLSEATTGEERFRSKVIAHRQTCFRMDQAACSGGIHTALHFVGQARAQVVPVLMIRMPGTLGRCCFVWFCSS